MPRTRAQREQEMVTEGGWADMREELLAMVLEKLQAAGQSATQGPFGFSEATATVRLVCSGWKAVHDAVVMRLVLRLQTTDEAVGMLARRFPAVVSLEFKRIGDGWGVLTDQGLRAVSSLTSLTSLNLNYCRELTDVGMLAVSNLTSLKSLNLTCCDKVTDVGMLAVSNLTSLKSLNLACCSELSDVGMRAVIK
jgi:hypothetical protein